MSKEAYIQYFNDLTDRERSVFFYCFILKIPQVDTSKYLKLSIHRVNSIVQNINKEIKVMPIKREILEAFDISLP